METALSGAFEFI